MFHVKCFSHHFSCFSLFSMFMTILLWLTQSGFLVLRPNFGRRLASHSTVVCIGALFTSFPIVAGSGSLSRSRLLYFSISRLRCSLPSCCSQLWSLFRISLFRQQLWVMVLSHYPPLFSYSTNSIPVYLSPHCSMTQASVHSSSLVARFGVSPNSMFLAFLHFVPISLSLAFLQPHLLSNM